MPEQPKPRRSPSGTERKRDAERSRERILEAALVEFGEHGYAGARISAIARRAGVNQQLISYYFDGKAGLFRALSQRWRSISDEVGRPDAPLADVVGDFVDAGGTHRHWARLLIWQALAAPSPDGANTTGPSADGAEADGTNTAGPSADGPEADGTDADGTDADGTEADSAEAAATKAFHEAMVEDLRRRQAAGELAGDLDPAYAMLALMGAAVAPTVLPDFARHFTGLDPSSPEFAAGYREQIRRLVAHLGADTPAAR
jgi:TetR/AcrR family transcriptional regulator